MPPDMTCSPTPATLITQTPSLSGLLKTMTEENRMMPGVVIEGAALTNATILAYMNQPAAVRRSIANQWLRQRPLNLGLQSQAVSAGIAFAITFTPDAVNFPGLWDQLIWGVLIEVDYPQNVAKGQFDATINGFGIFENNMALRVVTGQPDATPGGAAKVRVWVFPGEAIMGTAQYEPFSFRPALGGAGDPLVNAHNLVVNMAAGLPTGTVVTAHLLTRGHAEVDLLVNQFETDNQFLMKKAKQAFG